MSDDTDCGHGFTSWQYCGRCCHNRAFALQDAEREIGRQSQTIAALKRRIRLARSVVAPLVDWEMGEGSRGENSDPLRAALPLLDLRRPLPRGRR